MSTIFDKLVSGEWPCFKVYEDDDYMAFLTPFPNTEGHTVVIPKVNPGSYFFEIDEEVYRGLLSVARMVASKMKRAFGVDKVGMVVDGGGVPHAHVQLIPLHGFHDGMELPEHDKVFFEAYKGIISSVDGPKMDDEKLEEIRKKIAEVKI